MSQGFSLFKKVFGTSPIQALTKRGRVFLDYASTTPVRREVVEAMNAYTDTHFANPSALYIEARQAKTIMQEARAGVAEFLNCAKDRVVFTSGGTEGNNMAILGVFEKARRGDRETGTAPIAKPHIISVATEHPAVREVLDEVIRRGGEVTLLQPNSDGLITAKQVVDALTPDTVLISVMLVNNEIGVIQPVREIVQAVNGYKKEGKEEQKKEKNTVYPYIHTDACQAPLFQGIDVSTLGVDLLTLDGIKIGGPRASGILYVRHGTVLSPIMFGGGQEGGIRSGTEDVARMVGMSVALRLAKAERKKYTEHVEQLRDYFLEKILEKFPTVHVNGSRKHRAPNNINVCFAEVGGEEGKAGGASAAGTTSGTGALDAEYLVVALDTYGVACSYSSSCRTLKEDSSSYVVEALGKPECGHSSLRFTLGWGTTENEIDKTVVALEKAVKQVGR